MLKSPQIPNKNREIFESVLFFITITIQNFLVIVYEAVTHISYLTWSLSRKTVDS